MIVNPSRSADQAGEPSLSQKGLEKQVNGYGSKIPGT